ncbi:MgtC/SapB family protein [Leifsonia sp. C5G2]|uniref:MgtC/SapB family protein n=1 Tax=Leifsonia sp. C5G2 TaxID=2735269 RepID=UPI001585B2BD|nr:MgtC/SapB family protein [Leifsonia sp. C5G2]NUU07352.1 MgtC/SapB family protein [Leifsonia sp. C5G2]
MTLWLGGTELVTQLLLLLLAFVLSAVIGVERERRLKSAGLRTHILVGLGSALFTLVSAFGFTAFGHAAADPSRIAAQVVTGIGFVGAGVIFVHRGSVVGLTTAASIWVTAAVGMACGAGLPVLAAAGTALHLLAVGTLPTAERILRRTAGTVLVVLAARSGDAVARVLELCTQAGVKARVEELGAAGSAERVELHVRVRGGVLQTGKLVDDLAAVPGVESVRALDASEPGAW